MQFHDINKSSLYDVSSIAVLCTENIHRLDRKLNTVRKVEMVAYMYKSLKTMEN